MSAPTRRALFTGRAGSFADLEGAQLGRHRALELFARPGADRHPPGVERRRVRLAGVEGVEARQQLGVEIPQHDLIEPPVGRRRRLGAVTALPEELLGRAIPDELGEALVERSGALHVQRVVGNLVEDERGQLHGIARQGRREQRVLEPAECRKGAGWAQVGVEPLAPRTAAAVARAWFRSKKPL